jgi:hypothetical protein
MAKNKQEEDGRITVPGVIAEGEREIVKFMKYLS